MKPLFTILSLAILAFGALSASAAHVTFDYEPLYTTWGGSYGNSPGDIVMSEDGVLMSVELFTLGAYTGFNAAMIDLPIAGFGSIQTLRLNNISARFHFGGLPGAPGDVHFAFADLGGEENLQVNGAPVFEVPELGVLDGMVVAPGVLMHVSTWTIPGGHAGVVWLEGPVEKILVGGQEFWIDGVRLAEEETPCDLLVDKESQPLGAAWGGLHGDAPGVHIFTEDGIPVYLFNFTLGSYTGFSEGKIDLVFDACLENQTLQLNNINAGYDIAAAVPATSQVIIEFHDLGGDENLQVNGAPRYEGDLLAAPVNIAPGVLCTVNWWTVGGGICGEVILDGNVQQLLIGGQEFWVDNLCVYEGQQPEECDFLVDFETQPIGMFWGSTAGNVPGDMIFVEDSIPVGVTTLTLGAYTGFYEARIIGATDCLISHSCWTSNINLWFDIAAATPSTSSVIFEFQDYGGAENLEVNGAPRYEGDITSAPFNIAPGVTCTVVSWPSGSGSECGIVTLVGNVQQLIVGGQEFELDNICVIASSTDVGDNPDAAGPMQLRAPYPNPFNPKTELRFSMDDDGPVRLSIYDILGREIAVLVDGHMDAGTHKVVWEGKDARGKSVSSGVYFAKFRALGQSSTQKLVLSK
jgi:hypothetical protein